MIKLIIFDDDLELIIDSLNNLAFDCQKSRHHKARKTNIKINQLKDKLIKQFNIQKERGQTK